MGSSRAGLAPVELVLVLPLLLMVLALIINFGHQVAWKSKALTAARQGEWRQRPMRHAGGRDEAPFEWRPPERMGGGGAASARLFQNDPYEQFTVVRGPQLFDPQANPPASALQVDTSLVRMDSTVSEGSASVNRPLPLFQSLSRISFDVRHPLVESHWRFAEMGFGGNQSRRIERLYNYQPSGNMLNRGERFRQAALAILGSPARPALAVLDRDEELRNWFGSSPDFHPTLPRTVACDLDVAQVLQGDVAPLISRIRGPNGGGRGGVPEAIASRFRQMYQQQLDELLLLDPPPRAEIAELRNKIEILDRYLASLR
ncbi:MAG: TadE/TadG family type IV pilus assembly protein [Planctomycetaceae bacterium]